MNSYLRFVHRNQRIFLLILIPIFLYFGPLGFNAYNYVSTEVGLESLGTDQDVSTFTSLTDDVVIIVDGNEGLISEQIEDWTASFIFRIQRTDVFQDYAVDASSVENIFTQSRQLLSSYYTNVYTAMGFANISTYIILEVTNQVVNSWQDNSSASVDELIAEMEPDILSDIENLAFGTLNVFQDLASNWLDTLASYLNNTTRESYDYTTLIQQWHSFPETWSANLTTSYRSDLESILKQITLQTTWSTQDIGTITSNYLFNSDEQQEIEFLLNIFDNGNSATKPVNQAQTDVIPFILKEFLPPGFPEKIREYYLSTFTNSQGDTPPTSMIMRFRLKSDLQQEDLERLFPEIEQLLDESREELPEGIEIALLSYLNFQRERSTQISTEMHQVDLIAVFVGFLIMILILRDPYLSGLVVGIAWITTQVVRGIFVTLMPLFGEVNATSFSIGSTFLLGAAMNYTVFYKFRYFQERSDNIEHDEAIKLTSRTALHSVLISGFAVVLSMFPYRSSSMELLSDISTTIVIGMIIQIILFFHVLPVVFGSLRKFSNKLTNSNFHNIPTLDFKITPTKIRRIIFFSLVAGLISILVIVSLNSTIVATNVISNSGETGRSLEIIEEKYPSNYLSRYLIQIEFDRDILQDNKLDPDSISLIDDLSSDLAKVDKIESLISIAWPFGETFNFDQETVGRVEYDAAQIIADELVYRGNTTFIIVQSLISSESGDLGQQAAKIIQITQMFNEEHLDILHITISGLPHEIYKLNQQLNSELPGQIGLALFLLTAFLALILKSIFMPLRLEFSIILASLYSIAISSLLFKVITDSPLDIMVISSSFLILLGLGTDFDIYLYRRIQEEQKEHNLSFQDAIDFGVKKSAPAIISSGLVMAFSFLALLNSEISIIQQFGVLTFLTVIIDIFIVRTVIVPAILLFAHRGDNQN